MESLSLGVVATSRKPNERRLPIHPAHLEQIDPAVRSRLFLEQGYGERFGAADADLAPHVAGLLPREELLARCDVVVLPKPVLADLTPLRPGQVVWGWPHCVQDPELTQAAIDRGLTLIAWEAMNVWTPDGQYGSHIFANNNELAGYCSVLHALTLSGSTSAYGRPLRAAVISFGATARGAVRGLAAMGVQDILVLTQREVADVDSPLPHVRMHTFGRDPEHEGRAVTTDGGSTTPLAETLAGYDIVVNCILQDTDEPLMFVTEDELAHFAAGSLIVDVSCDEGMGFSWARPTGFDDPMFDVGHRVHYYAVDHSPSWLFNSTTWENSTALLPFLPVVAAGPEAWDTNETIRRAIEIRDGVVQNPRILSFQNRSPEPPHGVLASPVDPA